MLGGGGSPFVSDVEGAGSGDLPLPDDRESRSLTDLPVTSRSADPKRDAGAAAGLAARREELEHAPHTGWLTRLGASHESPLSTHTSARPVGDKRGLSMHHPCEARQETPKMSRREAALQVAVVRAAGTDPVIDELNAAIVRFRTADDGVVGQAAAGTGEGPSTGRSLKDRRPGLTVRAVTTGSLGLHLRDLCPFRDICRRQTVVFMEHPMSTNSRMASGGQSHPQLPSAQATGAPPPWGLSHWRKEVDHNVEGPRT